jgi:ligand-binding SRPBCC domain-containing protein
LGTLTVETLIAAPPHVCFDLARDVDAHVESASFSRERVVPPGRTSGKLELGDIVTFEGRHFGMRQRFTVKVVAMEPPHRYVDELVKSAFRSMRHVHEFEARGEGTLMRDTLEWVAPLGFLGRIADALFIAAHLRRFVMAKQGALKRMAESFDKAAERDVRSAALD